MKLLAWDTSSRTGCIAAIEWDETARAAQPKLVGELLLDVGASQSEMLLWGIDQMVKAARWRIQDVDVLGVGVGPGSFTGLRIGITTARTLGQTLNKPLVRVSSLAALARPSAHWLSRIQERTVLVAVTEATQGNLFALWGAGRAVADCVAMPQGDHQGIWKRGVEEQLVSPSALVKSVRRKMLEGKGATHWIAVGDGRHRYPELWNELSEFPELEIPVPFSRELQGRYVGLLAFEAYQAGLTQAATDVQPRYLQKSAAEIKMEKGLIQPAEHRVLTAE